MTYIAFIFFLWIYKCTSAEDFNISDYASSWYFARNECTLAVPKLTFNNIGFYTDFNATEKLWVGYAMVKQTFRYKGCIAKGNLGANYKVTRDVGRCFSACRTNIIGIQNNDTDCFCFDQYVQNVPAMCDKPCKFPENTACGGKKDKNAISVYERVSEYDPKQVLTESNFCKVFYQHSTEGWERCDAKHPYYCSFENGTFQNFDSSDTWLKASIKCLKEKGFLSEPKNVSVTVWMPEIRYKTIIRYTEVQDAELCGHLEKGFELNIGNCTNEKKSLCQKGTPTSTTTSTTEVIARSVGTSMSTATPPRSPDKMPSGNKTEDSGTSPVIYIVVSVAAFAIIATSIGTTLFWRKRKHTAAHKERRKKNIINKTYDPAAASSSPERNIVIYDEAEDIVSYFSNANPRTESNEVMGEENDATSGSRQVGNQESSKIDNVYHKLDLPDDTYDHTSTSHEFNNDRPTSNVYGMRSAGPTENQYGSPDDVPSDDTYNKVSEI